MEVKTYNQISAEIISAIESELNIETPPGSVVQILSNVVGGEIAKVYLYLNELITNMYIGQAGGELLDALGLIFGIKRKQAQYFTTISGIKFYVDDGTLGNYIPATYFTDNEVTVTDGSNTFKVIPFELSQTELNKKEVYVLCNVKNIVSSEVERESIDYSPKTDHLFCTNPSRILLQTSVETDDQLRYRISRYLAITRSDGSTHYKLGNKEAVRIAALSVSGVADAYVKEYTMGGGSFSVYIVGEDLNNDAALVPQVSSAINGLVGYGTNYDVKTADKTCVSVELSGSFSTGVEDAVETAIASIVDNTRIGSMLNYNTLKNIIISTAMNYGTVDSINIYTSFEDTLGIEHKTLLSSDYLCDDTEKLMLKPVTPVTVV